MGLDLKAYLDRVLFGDLLAGGGHTLKLYSILAPADAPLTLYLETTTFAEDVVMLLETPSVYLDFFRYPTQYGAGPKKTLLFGGDGVPVVGTSGAAQARLLARCSDVGPEEPPELLLEIFQRGNAGAGVVAVRAFYDLVTEKFKVSPGEIAKRFAPPDATTNKTP